MNKKQTELLEKSIKVKIDDKLPLFKGIIIIQQRKLHDSGYRMMYVIGHTEYDEGKKDFNYYLIGTFSDVIDFQPTFDDLLKHNYDMCDIHLDIDSSGIIHIWTNSDKRFRAYCPFVSSCTLEVI